MSVLELWLPILLAGIATHIASTIAWTVLPHHKPEVLGLGDDEASLQDWIASRDVQPGQYMFPFCGDMKEAGGEEFKKKQARCTGQLTVWEKPINMGGAIVKTLLFFIFTAGVIGALAAFAMKPGAESGAVFTFVFSLGVVAHCFAKFPHVFWFPQKLAMSLLDGVVYALVTALIFTLLWPAAEAVQQAASAI